MRTQRKRARRQLRGGKHAPAVLARMPGINFDTFEQEPEHEVASYGTDRAPTYQARYAAAQPRRYAQRIARWLQGSKPRSKPARKRPPRRRRRASRSLH